MPCIGSCTTLRLTINERCLQCNRRHFGCRSNITQEITGNYSREQLIDTVTLPPAVHVRLAKSQLALRNDTIPESLVMHTN